MKNVVNLRNKIPPLKTHYSVRHSEASHSGEGVPVAGLARVVGEASREVERCHRQQALGGVILLDIHLGDLGTP